MNRINFIVRNNIVDAKRTGMFYRFPVPFNA